MCCPCYIDNEQGMVIISYGSESYYPQCTLFLVHFLYLVWIPISPVVNRTLVHLKVNRDPHFQVDQSSVVWFAPEFE